jgi:quercetin dioxygenase-like cupin family protein
MHDANSNSPEVITNPVTGEIVRVLESTPEVFRFEFVLLPHGTVAAPHQHTVPQTIAARVGTLHASVEGTHHVLEPGQSVLIGAGQTHDQWNPADTEVWAMEEFRPAARMHDFFRVLFGMARDGLTDKKGVPRPLLASALFAEFSDSIRPGRRLDRILLAALRPLARLAGSHRVIQAYLRGNGRPIESRADRAVVVPRLVERLAVGAREQRAHLAGGEPRVVADVEARQLRQ